MRKLLFFRKPSFEKRAKLFYLALCFTLLLLSAFFIISFKNYQNRRPIEQNIALSCKFFHRTKERCLISEFDKVSKKYDLKTSAEILKKLKSIDSDANYCHNIAHRIVRNEVNKDPKNWTNLLKDMDVASCSEGYFHGLIEGYMGVDPEFTLTPSTMSDLCKKVEQQVPQEFQGAAFKGCIHTASHLLLVAQLGDVNKSLDICRGFGKDMHLECASGVFMEDAQRPNLETHGFKSRVELGFQDANYYINYCNNFKDEEHTACWVNNSWIFYRLGKSDPEDMYSNCRQALSDEAFIRCYASGEAFFAVLNYTGNHQGAKKIDYCHKIEDKEKYQWCSQYVLDLMLRSGDYYNEFAYQYCDLINSEYQDKCVKFVRERIEKLDKISASSQNMMMLIR